MGISGFTQSHSVWCLCFRYRSSARKLARSRRGLYLVAWSISTKLIRRSARTSAMQRHAILRRPVSQAIRAEPVSSNVRLPAHSRPCNESLLPESPRCHSRCWIATGPSGPCGQWFAGPVDLSAGPMSSSISPRTPKSELFARGYISRTSSHSRGTTVDLTMVLDKPAVETSATAASPAPATCRAHGRDRQDTSALDMGTTFDCFDTASHTASRQITKAQMRNRQLLVKVMSRHGFRNYRREWWHFSYSGSSSGTRYDFPIK